MSSKLSAKIESLLFYSQEATDLSYIAKVCEVEPAAVETALEQLQEDLHDRGVSLILHDGTAQLMVAQEFSDFITEIKELEINTDLTSAQSEALATVAYLAPVQKVTIDFIRGVNSRAVLRNLSARGLITKKQQDGKVRYNVTTDTLAHLGVTSLSELPDYEDTREKLLTFTQSDEVIEEMESAEN